MSLFFNRGYAFCYDRALIIFLNSFQVQKQERYKCRGNKHPAHGPQIDRAKTSVYEEYNGVIWERGNSSIS